MKKLFVGMFKKTDLSTKFFVLTFILGVFWLLFFFFRFPKQAWIDGLLEGWFMSKGLVIYKDFTSQYLPLLFLLSEPFHKLFGFTQVPTLALIPAASVITFMLITFVSGKWLKGWYRLLPLLFFLLWDPVLGENRFSTPTFQNIFNLLSFVVWFEWFKKPNRALAFVLGILLAITFLSCQITVFYLFVIFLSLLYKVLRDKKNFSSLIFLILGFGIPSIVVFCLLLEKNALYAMYYWNIRYYFSGGYPFSSQGKSNDTIILYLGLFSSIILIIGNFYFAFLNYIKNRSRNFLGLSFPQYFFWVLIPLSFAVPFWFGLFYRNRFQMGEAILAISVGMAVQLFYSTKKKYNPLFKKIFLGIFLGITIISIIFVIIPKYKNWLRYPRHLNILTKNYDSDPFTGSIKWIRDNTDNNSTLFATTDSTIYIETDRLPANHRASTNLPFVYRPLEDLKRELKIKAPDYWVIDERNWKRFHDFGYDDVTDFMKKILECEKVVKKFDYITIRKHEKGKNLCF